MKTETAYMCNIQRLTENHKRFTGHDINFIDVQCYFEDFFFRLRTAQMEIATRRQERTVS